jgi:hypothetical protein
MEHFVAVGKRPDQQKAAQEKKVAPLKHNQL